MAATKSKEMKKLEKELRDLARSTRYTGKKSSKESAELKELRKSAGDFKRSGKRLSKSINDVLQEIEKSRPKEDRGVQLAKRLERHKELVRAELKSMEARGLDVPRQTVYYANEPTPASITDKIYDKKMKNLNMNTVRARVNYENFISKRNNTIRYDYKHVDKRVVYAQRLEDHKKRAREAIETMKSHGLTVPQKTLDLVNEPTPRLVTEKTYNEKMRVLNLNTIRSRARIVIPEVYHPTDPSRTLQGDIDTEVRVTNLKNNINKILKEADPSTRLGNTLQLMVVMKEGKPAAPGMDNDFFTIDSEYDPKKDYELSKHIKFKKIDVDEAREILKNPFTNYNANEKYKKLTSFVSNVNSSKTLNQMSAKTIMDLEFIMNTSYAWRIAGSTNEKYKSGQVKSRWVRLFKHLEDVAHTDSDGLSKLISMIENEERFETIIQEANDIIKQAMKGD